MREKDEFYIGDHVKQFSNGECQRGIVTDKVSFINEFNDKLLALCKLYIYVVEWDNGLGKRTDRHYFIQIELDKESNRENKLNKILN
jgi:hypothetical protein